MNLAMQNHMSIEQKLANAWPKIKVELCAIALLICYGVVSNMDYDDQVSVEQAKVEMRLKGGAK